MIDIHTHLLPGIDDGAQTLDEALGIAKACVADGVSHVVLTPHVFPGRFNNLRSTIEPACRKFREQLVLNKVPLGISFAGEVRFSSEVLDMAASFELPFLGVCEGYRTLLLELPDALIPLGATTLIRRLMEAKIRPVIAHPERNKAVMEKPERIGQFIDAGCYLQITAGSLLGQFGARVGAATDYLLREGWVNAVASDTHNLEGRRPRMREARQVLERRFGSETAWELTRFGPAYICGINLGDRRVPEVQSA